ncbi:translation initiation factor IF-2 [Actinomyces sp. oral taxon 448 str. F0400]|nr:translation initiation factor IF-2 [Actinomyces sp. oral taxon 448 str. F0400]
MPGVPRAGGSACESGPRSVSEALRFRDAEAGAQLLPRPSAPARVPGPPVQTRAPCTSHNGLTGRFIPPDPEGSVDVSRQHRCRLPRIHTGRRTNGLR